MFIYKVIESNIIIYISAKLYSLQKLLNTFNRNLVFIKSKYLKAIVSLYFFRLDSK